ncbi:N-acetyltransferase [bacterium]|nr:MAG: N-acetyltransferase [bacterium]
MRLREIRDTDLPTFFEHQLDPEANRMAAFTTKDPADREAFERHWAKNRSNEANLMRAIVVDGHLVGYLASFVQFVEREVTYWIGREYWGRGLATRALDAFLKLVTERPVYGRAAADNPASIRVLEKCGFRIVVQERGFANARGEEIDEVVLRLDAKD